MDDTIAALASPAGPGIRAIVRVTGPDTRATVESVFRSADGTAWSPLLTPRRYAGEIQLRDWRTPVAACLLFWPGCRSYTGAPSAEFSVPGSPPLVAALLNALYAAGARPARAGEFTLRAFLAGRLDLLQAEAVLGVIDADDHQQLRQALDQLAGGLSGDIARLREQLLLHLADLEAGLDFVDEDIEFVSRDTLHAHLTAAVQRIETLAAQARDRLASTGRRQVVLAGLPNAGKSTLFNRLVDRDAAIVSPRRGTTRDVLCAELDLDGLAITLWDTAGCDLDVPGRVPVGDRDSSSDRAESPDLAAGRLRADRLTRADLIVWCTAADQNTAELLHEEEAYRELPTEIPRLRLRTRSDLAPTFNGVTAARPPGDVSVRDAVDLYVSGSTGEGMAALQSEIRKRLGASAVHRGELLGSTAARCRESLRRAADALRTALSTLRSGGGDELISVELRSALEALGEVCGEVYTDDVLDRIFSRFCIGK